MTCNTCGMPGAELLVHTQRCLRRSCFMFDRAHRERFERVWQSLPWPQGAGWPFCGSTVGKIVSALMFADGDEGAA